MTTPEHELPEPEPARHTDDGGVLALGPPRAGQPESAPPTAAPPELSDTALRPPAIDAAELTRHAPAPRLHSAARTPLAPPQERKPLVRRRAAIRSKAAAAVLAQPVPAARAATAPAVPPPVRPPRDDFVDLHRQVEDDRWERRPPRPHRLHVGSHVVSITELSRLAVTGTGTGLLLGVDPDRRPLSIGLFRPEPTRVTVVGGTWAVRLVALRSLALAAHIIVITSEASAWQALGERATGRSDRLTVVRDQRPPPLTARRDQPTLLIDDRGDEFRGAPTEGAVGPAPSVSVSTTLGPFQTHLTALRRLTPQRLPAVRDTDLVVVQRLDHEEATLVASALWLAPANAHHLRTLDDDMLAVISADVYRHVWTCPTSIERELAGGPGRYVTLLPVN